MQRVLNLHGQMCLIRPDMMIRIVCLAVLMRHQLPPAGRGQVIGLLGGSFDPAHAGHLQITRAAIARFGLDRVWWLVSPGNPLKPLSPSAIGRRMAMAQLVAQDPRITITGLEADLNTRHTAQILIHLRRLYPHTRFVWLMGADNLQHFHRWKNWRWIMGHFPIGVMARPNHRVAARHCKAATQFRHAQLRETEARRLPHRTGPAWCLINIAMTNLSSTAIRAQGDWPRLHPMPKGTI
jgi:nicotinate-nucleotide adenylyltransferase